MFTIIRYVISIYITYQDYILIIYHFIAYMLLLLLYDINNKYIFVNI